MRREDMPGQNTRHIPTSLHHSHIQRTLCSDMSQTSPSTSLVSLATTATQGADATPSSSTTTLVRKVSYFSPLTRAFRARSSRIRPHKRPARARCAARSVTRTSTGGGARQELRSGVRDALLLVWLRGNGPDEEPEEEEGEEDEEGQRQGR